MGGRRGGRGNVGARKRKERQKNLGFVEGFKGVQSNLLKVAKFLKKNN